MENSVVRSQDKQDDLYHFSILKSSRNDAKQRLRFLCDSVEQGQNLVPTTVAACIFDQTIPLQPSTQPLSTFKNKVRTHHLEVDVHQPLSSGNGVKQASPGERFKIASSLANMIEDPYAGVAFDMSPNISSFEAAIAPPKQEQYKREKKAIQEELAYRQIMAVPATVGKVSRQVIDGLGDYLGQQSKAFCGANPINSQICQKVAQGKDLIQGVLSHCVPGPVSHFVTDSVKAISDFVDQKAEHLHNRYRIEKQDTLDFFSGLTALTLEAARPLAGIVRPIASQRINYSKAYKKNADCFLAAREFIGSLKNDLVLVQYHSHKSLHQGRSWKWFTSVEEANRFSTIDQVMENLALLSSWGERTHVTVAKIPAGEKVRFLYGRAGPQVGGKGKVNGGGLQYRFYEFDPRWILETRKIPN